MADAGGHEPPVRGASAGQSQTIILASGAACTTDMAGTDLAKKRLDEEEKNVSGKKIIENRIL